MAGFKTIWLLLFLLALAACVPQKKQTQCGSNEAFNASLRTCVPIVGGPTSYVKVDTYLPTTAISKYVGSTALLTFSVTLTDPYAQNPSVRWQRYFNGVATDINPPDPSNDKEVMFAPSSLGVTGTYIISAKVYVGSALVDTHNFELVLVNNPTPIIKEDTVDPPDYAQEITHYSDPVTYSFDMYNGGATDIDDADYAVVWTLHRNGVLISGLCSNDDLTNYSPTGTNTADCDFDPADPLISGYTTGNFMLRARLTRTAFPVRVVDEQVWSITMVPPALSKITARGFYDGAGGDPVLGHGGLVVAYNNIPYSTPAPMNAYNFVPCTGSSDINLCNPVPNVNQAEFCVTFASALGSVPASPSYIKVDWYLDGSHVYSENTSVGDAQLCLTDGGAALLDTLAFSNLTNTTAYLHKVTARATDLATGLEYTAADMLSSLGTYPIEWNITVRPTNMAPAITIASITDTSTTSLATCATTTSSTAYSNCSAYTDNQFAVDVKIAATTGDDFYDFPGDAGNFSQTCRIYRDTVLLDTVAGAYVATSGGFATFRCLVTLPSYSATGPVSVHDVGYQILSEVSDNGSPIDTNPAVSNTVSFTFAAGRVFEFNSAPTVTLFSVSGAAVENDATPANNFDVTITATDPQRDNWSYSIEYCTNDACTASTPIYTGTVTRTTNALASTFTNSFTLPEDFLMNVPNIDCDGAGAGTIGGTAVLRNGTCTVYFRVTITDIPTYTGLPVIPGYLSPSQYSYTYGTDQPSVITNYNPAPVFTHTATVPSPTTYTNAVAWAFVGFPHFIQNLPSTSITDASNATSEDTHRYQWYAKNATSVNAWTAVTGATTPDLVWTPSMIEAANIVADNPIDLMLCIADYPTAAVATPNPTVPNASTCNTGAGEYWTTRVYNNIVQLADTTATPAEMNFDDSALAYGREMATWVEGVRTLGATSSHAVYTAMIGNDNRIHVKKDIVTTTAGINTIDSTLWVIFEAMPTGTTYAVKNLHMTGIDAGSLYISYLASANGTPYTFYPQIRRIDISDGKVAPNIHPGKFGFDYDGIGLDVTTCTQGCPAGALSGLGSLTFPAFTTIAGESMTLLLPNGNTFPITFSAAPAGDYEILAGTSGSATAANLAAHINASTHPLLAGYSATVAGNVLTFSGGLANDYYSGHTSLVSVRASSQAGKIYAVAGGNWYLPFLDSSLGGAHQDKISFYYGGVNTVIGNTLSIKDAITEPDLALTHAASHFDNDYDAANGVLNVALVTKVGSQTYVYRMSPTAQTYTDAGDSTTATADRIRAFSSDIAYQVQVASSGTYVFVALTTTSNTIRIGVYNSALSTATAPYLPAENDINSTSFFDPASITDRYFNYSDISSFRLISYGTEARIIALSKGLTDAPTADYRLYMARIRPVLNVWTISCGDCQEIGTQSLYPSEYVSIGVSSVANNLSLGYTGSYAGQGVRDVVSIAFAQKDGVGALATLANPYMGVFNVEAEAVGATDLPVADTGIFRSPFVKN